MTSDELKKLLDARKELFSDSYGQDKNEPYMVGFENAVELLWPLVEALEEYANADDDSESSPVTHAARQALQDLEQKLKGESI